MKHLSKAELEIRRSRGIPILRLLPFALPIIAVFLMSFDQDFLLQCIGKQIEGSGRGPAIVRLATALGCSPSYLTDFSHHWFVIAMFCLGITCAIPQIFWLIKHKTYWDAVREREKFKRAEKAKDRKKDQ